MPRCQVAALVDIIGLKGLPGYPCMPRSFRDNFAGIWLHLLPTFFTHNHMNNLFFKPIIVILNIIDPAKSLPAVGPLLLVTIFRQKLYQTIIFFPYTA